MPPRIIRPNKDGFYEVGASNGSSSPPKNNVNQGGSRNPNNPYGSSSSSSSSSSSHQQQYQQQQQQQQQLLLQQQQQQQQMHYQQNQQTLRSAVPRGQSLNNPVATQQHSQPQYAAMQYAQPQPSGFAPPPKSSNRPMNDPYGSSSSSSRQNQQPYPQMGDPNRAMKSNHGPRGQVEYGAPAFNATMPPNPAMMRAQQQQQQQLQQRHQQQQMQQQQSGRDPRYAKPTKSHSSEQFEQMLASLDNFETKLTDNRPNPSSSSSSSKNHPGLQRSATSLEATPSKSRNPANMPGSLASTGRSARSVHDQFADLESDLEKIMFENKKSNGSTSSASSSSSNYPPRDQNMDRMRRDRLDNGGGTKPTASGRSPERPHRLQTQPTPQQPQQLPNAAPRKNSIKKTSPEDNNLIDVTAQRWGEFEPPSPVVRDHNEAYAIKKKTGDIRRPAGDLEKEQKEREKERKEAEFQKAAVREFEAFAAKRKQFDDEYDNLMIARDYREALVRVLTDDPNQIVDLTDFLTKEGYYEWQDTVNLSFQAVLAKFIKWRFSSEYQKERARRKNVEEGGMPSKPKTIDLYFKVVQAQGLLAKEGKLRNAFVTIELKEEKWQTEVIEGTLAPVFNQHLNLTVKNIADSIVVSVMDARKDEHLGQVTLKMGDIISMTAMGKTMSDWFPLTSRPGKKDKWAGGMILIEAYIKNEEPQNVRQISSIEDLQESLIRCKVNPKSLYKYLLKSCLALDILANATSITEQTTELLSPDSNIVLRVFGRMWVVGSAFQCIAYLELLFEKYKKYEVPTGSLLTAYEKLYVNMKKNAGWLGSYDRPVLIDLLDNMHSYYTTQVSNYKEFYPKNRPSGALETTLLMLRMIHKNQLFRDNHPDEPESFREALRAIMTEAAVRRYQKLNEMCLPFDNTTEALIESTAKLSEMVVDEIELDNKFFRKPFKRELDILGVVAESFLKYFVLELENITPELSKPQAIDCAEKVFKLYIKVRQLDKKYAPLVPGLKRLSMGSGFNVERWFAPFVNRWLDWTSRQTLQWVQNAIYADKFIPEAKGALHSSSITDLFTAIHQELETIKNLEWSNIRQVAQFMVKYSKTMNLAIEQYCDAMLDGENKDAVTAVAIGHAASGLLWGWSAPTGPKDITESTGVKVSNVERALGKLDEIYRDMDVKSLNAELQLIEKSPTKLQQFTNGEVRGNFSVEVFRSEKLRPCNKNGLSHPYVVIRIPNSPITAAESSTNGVDNSKRTSTATDIVKSRVVYDSIAPIWDETFQVLLPPTRELEVVVYNKNLLLADEVIGKGKFTLTSRLMDHQTHDVWVPLDPQGKVLLRIMMEGEEEDIVFWFKKSYAKLLRSRDDFRRLLVAKMAPYAYECLVKAVKDQEAAPEAKGWLGFAAASTPGKLTATGISIDQTVNQDEAESLLVPLTDYFNKNFEILCVGLSAANSQATIIMLWRELLNMFETLLVPHLHGPIERDRKKLNRRQLSVMEFFVEILIRFFHADGEGLGIPYSSLETTHYRELKQLFILYTASPLKIKRDYELSKAGGKSKEGVLRLMRLLIEVPGAAAEFDATEIADLKTFWESEVEKGGV